jgi:D-beta-D-heptose 7-phosphate kinase/D-beta-D-heptose 1-phosphate adenosyltransferase
MGGAWDLGRFEQSRILVLGDIMLDRYLWGDVERISPEAPVPIFHIKSCSETPGGAGNVVSNLVALQASVTLVGVRGSDAPGERLDRLLKNSRIRTHIVIDSGRPTITKTRVISHGQQLLRLDEEEIVPLNADVTRDVLALVHNSLANCDAVVLSDYGKGLLVGELLVRDVIGSAKDIPVIVDPKGKNWDKYRGATCITPNTKELGLTYGEGLGDTDRLVAAMRWALREYDLRWLAVTRGSLGMCLMNENEKVPIFVPALARQVYDVSGAGDTVIATLALAVASGFDFPDAARLANLAAGIVVGKVGTQPVNLLELEASLATSDGGMDGRVLHKITSLQAAAIQVQAWKANGEQIVFTNGCFDLLHPGHIHLLNRAKELGGHLVVGLNSDASVRRLKGPNRPILHERDRAALVSSLDCVDLVVAFQEDTPELLIETLRPDILVKGSDYRPEEVVGRAVVESYGGQVRLLPLLEGYSTTAIADRVAVANRSSVSSTERKLSIPPDQPP